MPPVRKKSLSELCTTANPVAIAMSRVTRKSLSELCATANRVAKLQSRADPSLDARQPATTFSWVKCSKCRKWRIICVREVNARSLPQNWECGAMTWLPGLNSCEIPEQTTTAAGYGLHERLNLNIQQRPSAESGNLVATKEKVLEAVTMAARAQQLRINAMNQRILSKRRAQNSRPLEVRCRGSNQHQDSIPSRGQKSPTIEFPPKERKQEAPTIEVQLKERMQEAATMKLPEKQRRKEAMERTILYGNRINNKLETEASEADFWVAKATMEAAVLINSAGVCQKLTPPMEDARPTADLYLQGGLQYLETARHQEVICTGPQKSTDTSYAQHYMIAARTLDDCIKMYEDLPDIISL